MLRAGTCNSLSGSQTIETMKILIVEDVEALARNLETGFSSNGFETSICYSGEDAIREISTMQYDLLILDWMLPQRSGLEVLAHVRRLENWLPVIMLTARDAIEDRVRGLEVGADDYLVKPFAFAELLARVNSLLRRDALNKNAPVLESSGFVLDMQAHSAVRDGVDLDLTAREFELLAYLCRCKGQIVTRQMLISDVWKINARATPMDAVIDVNVSRLRKKADAPFERKVIRTIRGVGYKIEC